MKNWELAYSFGVNKPMVLPSKSVKRPNQPTFGISVFSFTFLAPSFTAFSSIASMSSTRMYIIMLPGVTLSFLSSPPPNCPSPVLKIA